MRGTWKCVLVGDSPVAGRQRKDCFRVITIHRHGIKIYRLKHLLAVFSQLTPYSFTYQKKKMLMSMRDRSNESEKSFCFYIFFHFYFFIFIFFKKGCRGHWSIGWASELWGYVNMIFLSHHSDPSPQTFMPLGKASPFLT